MKPQDKERKDSNKNERSGRNRQRDRRRGPRRDGNRQSQPGKGIARDDRINSRGAQMQLAFHSERAGLTARIGEVPVFPQSIQFQPVEGKVYDLSVVFFNEGRFGKALPANTALLSDDEWLSPAKLAAKLRQRLNFRWEEKKGGRAKFVARTDQGTVAFMAEHDAKGKTDGVYLVDLQERATYCLARVLQAPAERVSAGRTSLGAIGLALQGKVDDLQKLMPTVTQKFAVATPGLVAPTEKDISVTEEQVNVWEKLSLSPEAGPKQIHESYRELARRLDPAAILKHYERIGGSPSPTLKMNAQFAFETLEACRDRALAICQSRRDELERLKTKASPAKQASAVVHAATQAADQADEALETVHLTSTQIEQMLTSDPDLELNPGQYCFDLDNGGQVTPTMEIWEAIHRSLKTEDSAEAVRLAGIDPQLPLHYDLNSSGVRFYTVEAMEALERHLAAKTMAKARRNRGNKRSQKAKKARTDSAE